MKHKATDWILATRPWSFPASSMPVLATFAFMAWIGSRTGAAIDYLNGILSVVGIVLFHASGNVLSDYFDHKKQVDNKENRADMPLVSGSFTPREYLALSITLGLLGAAVGVGIMCRCGWELIFAGAGGALFTATYSTFKYNALGDLAIFASYALIPIMGTTFAVSGFYYYPALVLALPIGLITVAILHVNNTRDIESDRKAGIRTPAMLMGFKTATRLYAAELLLPFVLIAVTVICGLLPLPALAALLALPKAWNSSRRMLAAKADNPDTIASLDVATAQLQSVFSILLTVSLFISTWI